MYFRDSRFDSEHFAKSRHDASTATQWRKRDSALIAAGMLAMPVLAFLFIIGFAALWAAIR